MPEEGKKDYQVWSARKNATASFMVTPEAAYMVGTEDNFIVCSKEGTTIAGNRISKQTLGENERQGGMFVHVNDFSQMIPTTLVTPTPQLVPFPPLGFVTTILAVVPVFLAALQ